MIPQDGEKMDSKAPDAKTLTGNATVITEQIGVWQFATIKENTYDPRRRWNEVMSGLQLFHRLWADVSTISYSMLVFFILSKLWAGVESAILMHLSSRLLQILEVGLRDGNTSRFDVAVAIVNHLSCTVVVTLLNLWTNNYTPTFKARVLHFYEVYLMRTRLRMDLSAAQDPETRVDIYPTDAWMALDSVIGFLGEILTSISQLTLIVHMSRSSGGPMFIMLCVAKPLLKVFCTQDVWSKMWVVNLENQDYQRMDALSALAGDTYRQDCITGDLADYIVDEYEQARVRLGDTDTDSFWEQLERKSSTLIEVLSAVAGDLPMVYCAINAIINPSKFSIASIAVLQQSSSTLRWSLLTIIRETRSFQRHVSKLKNLYAISEKASKIATGDAPYPSSSENNMDGMSLELRDVTFQYPGSKNKSPALTNVSFRLRPGQLVVIVGANGSGKSTIVKLLTQLYSPTSGSLVIDGMPAHTYRPSDLRRTMAAFTQDHNLYPLPLYENISLGHVGRSKDENAVSEAAKEGGASEFIAKFVDGLDTILNPRNKSNCINVPDDPEHPLRKRIKMLSKSIDISGGERQRLVASRTFMHLNSGHVKFVAVDEPSSALDPEAELQLFDRLIAKRAGKTMVFVTHRFGHLTKRADLIICMKNGQVEESGCHEELMRCNGEYAKLYQIQADAFSSSST